MSYEISVMIQVEKKTKQNKTTKCKYICKKQIGFVKRKNNRSYA